jgi:hypothetical protein
MEFAGSQFSFAASQISFAGAKSAPAKAQTPLFLTQMRAASPVQPSAGLLKKLVGAGE